MIGKSQAVSTEWKRERVFSGCSLGLVLRLAFWNGDDGQLKEIFVFVVHFAITGDDTVALSGVVVFRCESYMITKDSALFLNDLALFAAKRAGEKKAKDEGGQRNECVEKQEQVRRKAPW